MITKLAGKIQRRGLGVECDREISMTEFDTAVSAEALKCDSQTDGSQSGSIEKTLSGEDRDREAGQPGRMSHPSDIEFRLPPEVRPLADARIAVRDYYRRRGLNLEFSFDGNLVGDLGEACAVEEYGMKLVNTRSMAGFDGHTPDGKQTVQVKTKGRSTKAIAFSYSEAHADHLLVLELDFDRGTGRAVYNGPERYVREFLPKEPWKGQKQVSLSQLRLLAMQVRDDERLPMVGIVAPTTR